MSDERSVKIILALLDLGSFGMVKDVEDAHEAAEKFLDVESPGWREWVEGAVRGDVERARCLAIVKEYETLSVANPPRSICEAITRRIKAGESPVPRTGSEIEALQEGNGFEEPK